MFYVGLIYGGTHGGGHLFVAPGVLTVEPTRLTRWPAPKFNPDASTPEPITHEGEEVTVLLSRLPTPVVNTTVLVQAGARTVAAGVGPFARRRLLRALEAAGFRLNREVRWLATGESAVTPWP